jgi:hypothetical protein
MYLACQAESVQAGSQAALCIYYFLIWYFGPVVAFFVVGGVDSSGAWSIRSGIQDWWRFLFAFRVFYLSEYEIARSFNMNIPCFKV